MNIPNFPDDDMATPAAWLDALAAAVAHGLVAQPDADALTSKLTAGAISPGELPGEVARLLADGPAPGMALDATAPAFKPGDVIELRALSPESSYAASRCGQIDLPAGRARLEGFVRQHMGGCNLYFGVNPRKPEMAGTTRAGRAEDVIARRIVVLDLDRKDAPVADPDWSRTLAELRKLDPLLVLESGNGFHVWLRIADIEGSALAASVAPLAAAMARIGADNMADLPRIARLPYTLNLPTASKRKRGAVVRLALPVAMEGCA